MDISIIIVTYNVREYISHCLDSIKSSVSELSYEIIIVDNASTDHSVELIKEFYSDVIIVKNSLNLGFSKGCNIGAKQAKGQYLLFLNPDMIIGQDSLMKFYEMAKSKTYRDVFGGELYDGSFDYLPESKRFFPTISSSLIRLFRIDKMVSIKDYRYYHSKSTDIEPVEVLTGALIFIAKSFFNEIGQFSEQYFMYGEDIDLCKRISQYGGQCWLAPQIKVIHFKGESSNYDLNYFRHFYQSLSIYAITHLLPNNGLISGIVSLFMKMLAVFRYLILKAKKGFFDLLLFFAIFVFASLLWAISYHQDIFYFDYYLVGNIGLFYAIIIVLIKCLIGDYLHQGSLRFTSKSNYGFILISVLAISSLLPESIRISRAVLLLSTLIFFLVDILISRAQSIRNLVFSEDQSIFLKKQGLYFVSNQDVSVRQPNAKVFKISDMNLGEVLGSSDAVLPFFYSNTTNSLYSSRYSNLNGMKIDRLTNYKLGIKRSIHQKRMLDLTLTVLLFPLFVVFILLKKSESSEKLKNLFLGKLTFVGYDNDDTLPFIPHSLLSLGGNVRDPLIENKSLKHDYALHYTIWTDLTIILTNFGLLLNVLWIKEEVE